MVPGVIRKTLIASGIGSVAVASAWSLWDWRAALTFMLAVAWAMGNVLVWTQLIQHVLVVGKRRPLAVFGWLAAKLGMLAGGFFAVWAAAPLSLGQTIGLTVGVFSVLLGATILAFFGAFLEKSPEAATQGRGASNAPGAGRAAGLIAAFFLGALLVAHSTYANAPAPAVGAHDAAQLAHDQEGSAAQAHGTQVAENAGAHEAEHSGGAAEHEGGEHAAKPELPNFITVLLQLEVGGKKIADTPLGHFLHTYEYQVFLVLITVFLCAIILATAGLRALIPGPTQALLEIVVEGFLNFFAGVLGSRERARRHMPFFGSIFLFIWFNNMFGIVPLFTGATSTFQLTASLAVLVFFYVHVNAIREAGFKHWLMHLLQDPKDAMGWVMAPLFFVLHVIGELAKPLSLSLRLFGNITGEHILSGVFLILGLMLMSAIWPHPWVGVPLHLPFLFLSLLVGTIQAVVFTLLSTIYLALFLPHDDHHEHGAEPAATHAH